MSAAENNLAKIPRGQTPERREYMKAYYARMTPEQHARKRAYKANYDATHQVQGKAYRDLNKEKLQAVKKVWYTHNRDRVLLRTKIRSVENRDSILAYQARYYAENTDLVKSNVRAYQKANPDKKAHCENRRRARKFFNGGSHTLDELQDKFAQFGNRCFYCGIGGRLTIDHDIPLSRGGSDNIDNILPACKPCNSRKSAKTALEFIATGKTNHSKTGGVKPGDEGR